MVRKAKLRCHGSRGRRRLTGLRDDAPSEARGADGGRATHGHTKPPPDGHHPGDKAAPQTHTTRARESTPQTHTTRARQSRPRAHTPPGHDKAAIPLGHQSTPRRTSPGRQSGLSVTNVVLKFRV